MKLKKKSKMVDGKKPDNNEVILYPASSREITFSSGYRLRTLENIKQDTLHIEAPDGKVCISVKLTPEGPMLELSGIELKVETSGKLQFTCGEMDVRSEKHITFHSGGDINYKSQGDIAVQAEGSIETEGFSQSFRARRGDIEAIANDDVFLNGERIRLNSPRTSKKKGD